VDQKNAWVNLETAHHARRAGAVPTLSTTSRPDGEAGPVRQDFAVSGTPKSDGKLALTIEGKEVSVNVKKASGPPTSSRRSERSCPAESRLVLGGDVKPYEMESYKGTAAKKTDAAAHLVLYKPDSLGLKPGEKPLRVVVTGYGAFMASPTTRRRTSRRRSRRGRAGAIVEYGGSTSRRPR